MQVVLFRRLVFLVLLYLSVVKAFIDFDKFTAMLR